jgi:hypothetical protein
MRKLTVLLPLLLVSGLAGCSGAPPYSHARIRPVGDNNGAGYVNDRAGCLREAQGPGPLKPVIINDHTGGGVLGGIMFEDWISARQDPPDLAAYEECLTKRGSKVTWPGGKRPGP